MQGRVVGGRYHLADRIGEGGMGAVYRARDLRTGGTVAATVLHTLPAFRGVATGGARVVRSVAEADRVQDGDILICDMTTLAWTRLFAGLAGIAAAPCRTAPW